MMKEEDNDTREKNTQHLEELMGDIDLYGWERVCTYRRVWLS